MADPKKGTGKKPKGSDNDEPTGVIVESQSDKVAVGPPCYIWLPNELQDLVQAHSMMSSKFLYVVGSPSPEKAMSLSRLRCLGTVEKHSVE